MNRREDFAIDAIDRRRERQCDRMARTARRIFLDWRANGLIVNALSEVPAADRPDLAKSLARAARMHLVIHQGEASAAAILSREAYEAGRNLMPRTDAREAAEGAFAGRAR